MAMGAIRCLRDAGLSVPRDIAVIGFDDIPEAALADPRLTTVRQPALQMGASAARALFDLIEHHVSGPSEVTLATELVIRASCGADIPTLPQGRFSWHQKEVISSVSA